MSAPVPTKSDEQLWLSYGVKLKSQILQGQKGTFWLATLSAAGIAASSTIPQEITNQGIWMCANTLLDDTSPVFNQNAGSYYQFMQRYIPAIKLKTDATPGQVMQYQQDVQIQTNMSLAVIKAWKDARDAYTAIYPPPDAAPLTFYQWIAANGWPPLPTAISALNAASATVQQDLSIMHGTDAQLLSAAYGYLTTILNGQATAGLTMACCDLPALIVEGGSFPSPLPSINNPIYNLNQTYASAVDGWIRKFNNDPTSVAFSLNFDVSTSASNSWQDLGFSQTTKQVSTDYIFFSAYYTENNTTKTSYINASSSASDINVTVTMSSFGTFPVSAGKWALDDLSKFDLLPNAPADLKLPKSKVSSLAMGYGIGIEIKLSTEYAKKVDSLIQTVQNSTGDRGISIFGVQIGDSSSSSSSSSFTQSWSEFNQNYTSGTLRIKPQANGFPTLIGAIGTSV